MCQDEIQRSACSGNGSAIARSAENPLIVVLHEMARISEDDHRARVASLARRMAPACRILSLPPRADRSEVTAAYAKAQALVTRRLQAGAPPLPHLRLLQVPASGHDLVDAELLPEGATLCNLAFHEVAMSEYTFAAMLDWTIGLSRAARQFRDGQWQGSAAGAPLHGELHGRTLAILGFGRVGAALAERARAFGLRVEAMTRSGEKECAAVARWHRPDERVQFLGNADFLVLACPLNDETRGMVDSAFLAALPPKAVLVNIARAEIVDEEALYRSLQSGRIAGAVLDTWWQYPTHAAPSRRPSRLPFHELANVVMTPHLASWTDAGFDRRWDGIARNLENLASGRPLEHVVERRRATIDG